MSQFHMCSFHIGSMGLVHRPRKQTSCTFLTLVCARACARSLQVGPKLLKFVPGEKAADLRNWLRTYAFWNAGGGENVKNAMKLLTREYFASDADEGDAAAGPGGGLLSSLFAPSSPEPEVVIETPDTGVVHPRDSQGGHFDNRFFGSAAEYLDWYRKEYAVADLDLDSRPVVAVLLYKKHVITRQPYINRMILCLEEQGLLPIPIFINGIEAHTIVRDQLTSAYEIEHGSPPQKAVAVDGIINTIGFPLVGGPGGTMEGARQAEIANRLLRAKNVPYVGRLGYTTPIMMVFSNTLNNIRRNENRASEWCVHVD